MSTIVRYSVWIRVEDGETMDRTALAKALGELPGFMEASWEDSYKE